MGAGGLVLRSQAACMKNRKQRERRDGQPRHLPLANGTGRSLPNAFALV